MTEAEPMQQVDRTYVRFRGRKLSYFSGCDYFRMASHPAVLRAVKQGVDRYGLNVASSRVTTGNHRLYRELEHKLAQFFGAEDALLVSSGYMTGIAVTQALAGKFTHALMDERAHVCLRDAAQFLGCQVVRFKHRDPADVARRIKRCGKNTRVVLITDGMYGGQGTAAPLAEYLRVLPKSALLLVDDAHGGGVLGGHGRGTPEFTGAQRRRIVQTGTLSKAFGVYGGAILCSRKLRREIIAKSHFFAGSTPLPLPLAHAALTALALHRRQPELRVRLNRNAARVKSALRAAGVIFPESPGPIVQIVPANARQATRMRQTLLAAHIYPPFLRYPGGPPGGSFRFVISSEHTPAQLDGLAEAVCRVCGRNSQSRRI
jgi:7-keto-8-aminopelargonate synthetase-like enzyme